MIICMYCRGHMNEEEAILYAEENDYICPDCYYTFCFSCVNCGDVRFVENRRSTRDGDVCGDCYDSYYVTCRECGTTLRMDEAESDYDYYCEQCFGNHSVIRNYHDSRNSLVFRGGDSHYYYGVELEVDDGEDREDCARDLSDLSPAIHFEEDGSLYNGFEIVTDPCSLAYHMEELPWHKICDVADDYGFRSHDTDTCGLHVHVSRTAFGQDTIAQELNIAKVIIMINNWWDKCVAFSRRDIDQLEEWAKKPDADIYPTDSAEEISEKLYDMQGDRYQAVNLCNRDTVEFRLFRGTLKTSTILASIQWVEELINYATLNDLRTVVSTTWSDVFAETDFKELNQYLKERDLI